MAYTCFSVCKRQLVGTPTLLSGFGHKKVTPTGPSLPTAVIGCAWEGPSRARQGCSALKSAIPPSRMARHLHDQYVG